MAKTNREVTDKKHKVRRAFIISTIATAALTVGIGAMAIFSASPILLALDGAVLACALFTAIGTGVSINKIRDSAIVSSSKKSAKKNLEKIKALNQDKSSTYSREYRAKVVKRFANANLKLCSRRGGTSFGVFKSSCGLENENAAEILNKIDSYTLLKDTATTNGERKKFAKKLILQEQKLSKIIEEEGVSTSLQRWTKSYDNVVSGVSVLDRRTEIACLTTAAKESFATIFENSNEKTDNKAGHIIVRFSSNIRPTMARVEDQTKINEVKEILLNDVVEACKTKTALEVRSMFPISLEAKVLNKETTKILNNQTITVNSITELKELLSPANQK